MIVSQCSLCRVVVGRWATTCVYRLRKEPDEPERRQRRRHRTQRPFSSTGGEASWAGVMATCQRDTRRTLTDDTRVALRRPSPVLYSIIIINHSVLCETRTRDGRISIHSSRLRKSVWSANRSYNYSGVVCASVVMRSNGTASLTIAYAGYRPSGNVLYAVADIAPRLIWNDAEQCTAGCDTWSFVLHLQRKCTPETK